MLVEDVDLTSELAIDLVIDCAWTLNRIRS
jgi:hypothetical protein